MKTFKVWYTIYDDQNQRTSSGINNIETIIQAKDWFQVKAIIEGQYNGCAKLQQAIEIGRAHV